MTLESRYLIEFSDILGCEFECHACKGKVLLGTQCFLSIPTNCPLCNESWLPPTEEEKAVRQLVNLFKNPESLLRDRAFGLRLQIALPEAKEP